MFDVLLLCTAELLLRAFDNANDLDDLAVARAVSGLRRAVALTNATLTSEAHGARGARPTTSATPLGPADLATARAHVREGLADGVDCPCCGQSCKLYPRKLYAEMGAWLIWLVKAYEQEQRWYSVNEGPKFQHRAGGGDYGKLVHWKLVERAPNDNPAKRTSGLWRPTQAGMQFAMSRTQVPSHVYLYDNVVHRFGDDRVWISEVLGERFNYAELMTQREM